MSDLLHTYLGVPYEDMEALSQMSRAKMSVALKKYYEAMYEPLEQAE